MFDRSWLPPALFEFVVLADTHYMVDPRDRPLEFESRRKQTARVEHALQLAAALETPLVIHPGDISQELPGSALHAQALAEARAQLERHLGHGGRVRYAAGNQDIGDKPDPTMPTEPVTGATLARFEQHFGPTWHSVDAGGCHFVVLNSSILNAALPAAGEQQAWVEADLAAHDGARTFLFLHHPPYLYEPQEPALGHYDNLGPPARAWLLDLVRRHRVECLFAGHSHFAWFDRIDAPPDAALAHGGGGSGERAGAARYHICVSTSFTRPGFGELFSGRPPDEHGRDDTAKLGFSLARVHEDGVRLHFIRTGGQTALSAGGQPRLLTRLPRDLPASPLGVTLTHPLTSIADVPLAWPSVVRQRVRNDYPFLSLLELGARHVRFPLSDLDDALQRRRLALLRDEGIATTATCLWRE